MTAEELADAAAADGLEDDMLDDETFGADFDQGEEFDFAQHDAVASSHETFIQQQGGRAVKPGAETVLRAEDDGLGGIKATKTIVVGPEGTHTVEEDVPDMIASTMDEFLGLEPLLNLDVDSLLADDGFGSTEHDSLSSQFGGLSILDFGSDSTWGGFSSALLTPAMLAGDMPSQRPSESNRLWDSAPAAAPGDQPMRPMPPTQPAAAMTLPPQAQQMHAQQQQQQQQQQHMRQQHEMQRQQVQPPRQPQPQHHAAPPQASVAGQSLLFMLGKSTAGPQAQATRPMTAEELEEQLLGMPPPLRQMPPPGAGQKLEHMLQRAAQHPAGSVPPPPAPPAFATRPGAPPASMAPPGMHAAPPGMHRSMPPGMGPGMAPGMAPGMRPPPPGPAAAQRQLHYPSLEMLEMEASRLAKFLQELTNKKAGLYRARAECVQAVKKMEHELKAIKGKPPTQEARARLANLERELGEMVRRIRQHTNDYNNIEKEQDKARTHFYSVVLPSIVPDARIALLRLRNKSITKELDSCGAHVKQLTSLSNELARQYHDMKENKDAHTQAEIRSVHDQYMEYYKELGFYVEVRKPMLRETSHVRGILRDFDRTMEDQHRLSEEEVRRRKYRNLMRNSERQWLLQIQMKQMQSENPYVDDFYYNTYVQQLSRRAGPNSAPVPLVLPSDSVLRLNRHLGEYVPRIDGANALGKVTTFSVRAPRSMIAIERGEGQVGADAEVDASTRAERSKQARKQALLCVERAYKHLFQVEDIDLRASSLDPAKRREVFKTRQELLTLTLTELHISLTEAMPEDEDAAAEARYEQDAVFVYIVQLEKGLKLIARMLRLISPQQLQDIVVQLMRIMPLVSTSLAGLQLSDDAMKVMQVHVVGAVGDSLRRMPLALLTSIVRQLTDTIPADSVLSGAMFGLLGGRIVSTVLHAADAALRSGQIQPDLIQSWTVALTSFFRATLDTFQRIVKKGEVSSESPDLWSMCALGASHCGSALARDFQTKLVPHISSADAPMSRPFVELLKKIEASSSK